MQFIHFIFNVFSNGIVQVLVNAVTLSHRKKQSILFKITRD